MLNLVVLNIINFIFKNKKGFRKATWFFTAFCSLFLISCSDPGEKFSIETFNLNCAKSQVPGEYIIRLQAGEGLQGQASGRSMVGSFGSVGSAESVGRQVQYKKVFASSLEDLKIKYADLPIDQVEPNYRVSAQQSQISNANQEASVIQSILRGYRLIEADFLWSMGFYGQGVLVGLSDSGYDFNHPLLQGTVDLSFYDSGADEDRNGFFGDSYGWNFIHNRPLHGDEGFHGTAVGSIIAGRHIGDYKVGVAPEAKMIPAAALNPNMGESTDIAGDSNSVLSSLDYLKNRGAHIINASWGGENCSGFLKNKLKNLDRQGIIVVSASGNEGRNLDWRPHFPTSFTYPLLLSVGASNHQGLRLKLSNFGSMVDFLAMGANVSAARTGGGMLSVSGTSMATPYISGSLALLKSAFPMASSDRLVRALKQSRSVNKVPNLKKAYFILQNQR